MQTIHMKYHTLFLSKTRRVVTKFVVCSSREMLRDGTFHQVCTVLFRQNQTQIQYLSATITCDPSIYIMDHPGLTVPNFMGNTIGLKWAKLK